MRDHRGLRLHDSLSVEPHAKARPLGEMCVCCGRSNWITAETLSLMILMGWLSLSLLVCHEIDRVLHYTYGLLLLIIFALIVSGQLRGTKRSRYDETRKPDP